MRLEQPQNHLDDAGETEEKGGHIEHSFRAILNLYLHRP